MMKILLRSIALMAALSIAQTGFAQDIAAVREAKAVEAIQQMSQFIDSLEEYAIKGSSSSDARLPGGLVVSNLQDINVVFDLPGSMHFEKSDGEGTQHLIIHEGHLTLFNSEEGYYAHAETPEGVEQAVNFAFDELEIDLPLMDLIRKDTFSHLVDTNDSVLFLTDQARVKGVPCDQVAIRSAELDIQIWIQKGETPLPRRLILTSKWSGGAPRFVADMEWDLSPSIAKDEFDFTPPEGASEIVFASQLAE